MISTCKSSETAINTVQGLGIELELEYMPNHLRYLQQIAIKGSINIVFCAHTENFSRTACNLLPSRPQSAIPSTQPLERRYKALGSKTPKSLSVLFQWTMQFVRLHNAHYQSISN